LAIYGAVRKVLLSDLRLLALSSVVGVVTDSRPVDKHTVIRAVVINMTRHI
jgi:hypothetical protein